jgi:hypothetical protein
MASHSEMSQRKICHVPYIRSNQYTVYLNAFLSWRAKGIPYIFAFYNYKNKIAAFPINPLPYRAKTSCRFHLKNVTLAETEWNLHFSNEICNICTNQGWVAENELGRRHSWFPPIPIRPWKRPHDYICDMHTSTGTCTCTRRLLSTCRNSWSLRVAFGGQLGPLALWCVWCHQ